MEWESRYAIGVLEVLVEAALLGVKDHVLVDDGEEALIVRLFPLGVRVVGKQIPLSAQVFQLRQGLFALFQGLVVDVLFGVDDLVEQELLENGEQVGKNPVQAHPGGDEEAQKQGDAHGQEGGAQLARHPLFRLEGVHPVLRQAEGKGSQPRRDGHQQGQAAGGGGDVPQVQAQEAEVQGS